MANPNSIPATVTVACKLPNGIILRLHEMAEVDEVGPMGVRKVQRSRPTGRQHVVFGNSHAQNKAPAHVMQDSYALTYDVPGDLWYTWAEQNKDADIIRNGLIFAHGEEKSVKAEAKEKAQVKSGMERLDPNNMPKGLEAVKRPR